MCPLNQSIINPLTRANCHAGQTLNNCPGAHSTHWPTTHHWYQSRGPFLTLRGEDEGQDFTCHPFVFVMNLNQPPFYIENIQYILHVFGRSLSPQLKCVDLIA